MSGVGLVWACTAAAPDHVLKKYTMRINMLVLTELRLDISLVAFKTVF